MRKESDCGPIDEAPGEVWILVDDRTGRAMGICPGPCVAVPGCHAVEYRPAMAYRSHAEYGPVDEYVDRHSRYGDIEPLAKKVLLSVQTERGADAREFAKALAIKLGADVMDMECRSIAPGVADEIAGYLEGQGGALWIDGDLTPKRRALLEGWIDALRGTTDCGSVNGEGGE